MGKKALRLVLATFVGAWMMLGVLSAPAGAMLPADDAAAQASSTQMSESDKSPLQKEAEGAAPSQNQTDLSFDSKDLFTLSNGLEFYALLTAVGGIMISGALWALGSRGDNIGQELAGKRGLILCLTAAFLIGALPIMATFLSNQANAIAK